MRKLLIAFLLCMTASAQAPSLSDQLHAQAQQIRDAWTTYWDKDDHALDAAQRQAVEYLFEHPDDATAKAKLESIKAQRVKRRADFHAEIVSDLKKADTLRVAALQQLTETPDDQSEAQYIKAIIGGQRFRGTDPIPAYLDKLADRVK